MTPYGQYNATSSESVWLQAVPVAVVMAVYIVNILDLHGIQSLISVHLYALHT